MTSHYLDCRLTVERQDYNFMFTRLYKVAHSLIGKNQTANIGLSFPQYHDDGQLGEIIRFFADQATLALIKRSESLNLLQDCHIITMTDIQKTPDICQHVCFYRQRLNERLTTRYQQKRANNFKEHLKKRGIIIDKQDSAFKADNEQRFIQYQEKVNERAQYLQFTSSENGFTYSLRVQKTGFTQPRQGKYNSFGLSNRKNGTTVPFDF